ncbi:MAG: macro domain-containing protein [candidate division Zixibacteria bacterium]|nr:macro domain-containing protein [candidate division Zixibacteria bacterium]
MPETVQAGSGTIRLMKVDITDVEIEAFVYYASHDLNLGSGYGTAIAMRGGPPVQEELSKYDTLETTQAVVTGAGEMKAQYIVHAVGPRFQEENLEDKLRTTIVNALAQAEARGITSLAFPPMGTGFYGVPLDVSARIMIETLSTYAHNSPKITDIAICVMDNRESKPFEAAMAAHGRA